MESFKYSEEVIRPWGSYHIIDNSDREKFLKTYFPHQKLHGNEILKFLKINPYQRLSWQYHKKRREEWFVVQGPVKAYTSWTNEVYRCSCLDTGDIISIAHYERHMLESYDTPSIIAEIWVHVNISDPSTEEDIIRVTDNYGRV